MDISVGELYIDGKFREASDGSRYEVINPADESVTGTASDATETDVADAVSAARNAFDHSSWSSDRELRIRCLTQLAEGLRAVLPELMELNVKEAGLPANIGVLIEPELDDFAFYINLIKSFEWETTFPPNSYLGMNSHRRVVHEPYGVVVAITPWNSPTIENLWKSIPALAAGNTVVLKPAPETPLAAALLARVVHDSTDIPAGVFNVITSKNNAVSGDGLTGDPRVDMFTFTGSTAVGERVAQRAAVGSRKVVLELGGKSANIVLDDADIDASVQHGTFVSLFNSGQGCVNGTRMIVQAAIYDEVVEKLTAFVGGLELGDPSDLNTLVGPIVRADQLDRIEAIVDRAREAGANIVVGGRRSEKGSGFWYEPTLIVDVDENDEVAQTEIFGPVLCVIKCDGDDEEAIRIANNSKYGLSAYVQSRDLARAERVARALRTGSVNINASNHFSVSTPFGGYGSSGTGREHGIEGWREFLQTKTVAHPAETV